MLFTLPFLLLLFWIAAGALLLRLQSRPAGVDYRRKTDRRIVRVGESVEVELRLIPPFAVGLVQDHDVVLALDHSGSMGSGPASALCEAVRAAENFVRRCPEQIHVGVVAFDHEADLECPLSGDSRMALRSLASIRSGGGTAIDLGLERAAEALSDGRPGVDRTVILLSDGGSDRDAAERAAGRLREAGAEIITVGFGAWVDEELMISISGSEERYCHVNETEDLETVFGLLAAVVSGQMAVSSVVDEGARAPSPFTLDQTGGLYPMGVHPGETTRIVWSVPLFDLQPVALTYRLVPECPGWHAVATDDAKASWRMPDGTQQETAGPMGPKVLVLPDALRWAWPVLNPLFWMLFGRFFCNPIAIEPETLPELEALPQPSLPEPLAVPAEQPYQATVRPALVIGLGELGEQVLCQLKDRLVDGGLADRLASPGESSPDSVELLNVSAAHHQHRPPVRVGASTLDDAQRFELCQDLRPYVETLRGGASPMRAWVPWRRWLADSRPLTTLHGVAGDRRKARLALLQMHAGLEGQLETSVHRIQAEDGHVILVAAADDAEGSGLVGEVAHVCASYGSGVTAVLTRSTERGPSLDTVALERELARLISLRGDALLSDRKQPPVSARKLFDRVTVLPVAPDLDDQEPDGAAANSAAELIWGFLAYRQLEERLQTAERMDDGVTATAITLDSFRLPAWSLWAWVRERTLARAFNGRWLDLEVEDGNLLPRLPASEEIEQAVEEFWSPSEFRRPQNRLLVNARAIRAGGNPIAALLDQLPSDALHHEQVSFHRQERQAFEAFCEEWVARVLNGEQQAGRWGLPLLMAALRRVESDHREVVSSIEEMSGNQDFQGLAGLAVELYADQAATLSQLAREVGLWIAALVGEWAELGATSDRRHRDPVCLDVERRRQVTEEALRFPSEPMRAAALERADDWSESHGDALVEQLQFRARLHRGRLRIELRLGDRELTSGDDVAAVLREMLDRYRVEVLTWPLHEAIEPLETGGILRKQRLGKHSMRVFPKIAQAIDEEDPYLVAAVEIQQQPLDQALGVVGEEALEAPFAWPEEANSERIAEKIRHSALKREPETFSPLAVHLLREPEKLHAFLADLASGRVGEERSELWLQRDGERFRVGEPNGSLEASQALAGFERVARQVVAIGTSLDREPIPASQETWQAAPDEAVASVETHPLARAASASARWAMWRDVIRGLALEMGGS